MWAASKRLRLWLKDFFLSLKDFSLSLSFFLPGLGVACDPQALGPPDHQSVYLVSALGVLQTVARNYRVGSVFLHCFFSFYWA